MSDTYEMQPHGWTCFHCGETFTTVGGARDHFGAKPDAMPGCMIRVSVGAERGLLMSLRKVEAELTVAYRERGEEDSHLHREIHRLQSRHADALQNAEEAGYARGLRDAPREADYEQVLADHRRLVRELDVALNGEAGAAPQASLCDIVSQVKAQGRRDTAVRRMFLARLENAREGGPLGVDDVLGLLNDCDMLISLHTTVDADLTGAVALPCLRVTE